MIDVKVYVRPTNSLWSILNLSPQRLGLSWDLVEAKCSVGLIMIAMLLMLVELEEPGWQNMRQL